MSVLFLVESDNGQIIVGDVFEVIPKLTKAGKEIQSCLVR